MKLDFARTIAYLCALTGVVCLCIAVWSTVQTRRFLATDLPAAGTVTAIVPSQDRDSNRTFAPRVRYLAEGQAREFTSILTSVRPAYRVGQEVRVLYDPAAPGRGRLDNWWGHRYVTVVSAFFGVAFSALGFGTIWVERRRSANSSRSPQREICDNLDAD